MSHDRIYVTRDTLNDYVEFNSPFRVHSDSTISDAGGHIMAPETLWDEDSLSGLDLPLMRQYGFTPLNGHATNGLIRHPSEYLDGQLAQDILGEPGVYCVTEVIDPDDTDALIGWSISRYEP